VPATLEVAVGAAKAVGELLRDRWLTRSEVRRKGPVDLLTDADLAAEALLLDLLEAATPGCEIVAEETRADGAGIGDCWYVDPLDGTTNFAHRFPHFAISIAFARRGVPEIGAVYDPLRDEMFSSRRGQGAWLNGHRIHVSETGTLNDALLGTGFPYDRRDRAAFYLRHVERFMVLSQGLRRAGAAALDLCYVAAGRLDGFWEWGLRSWDTAAGILLVEEAGGTVSDVRGMPYALGGRHILATNGLIHGEMRTVFLDLPE
jgi:myo-inositol-1(or 4)-monophosphatase